MAQQFEPVSDWRKNGPYLGALIDATTQNWQAGQHGDLPIDRANELLAKTLAYLDQPTPLYDGETIRFARDELLRRTSGT